MATQFRLAALGHTMEKGRVVEWHVGEGSNVAEGQLLVSIETDKTVVEVESPVAGVLLRIVGQTDGEYEVGALLAWIGEADEVLPEVEAPAPLASSAPAGSRVTPVARRLADRHGVDAEAIIGTGPGGRVTKEDVQRAIDEGTAAPPAPVSDQGVEVTPLAGIRRTTAERLGASWAAAPHVTEGVDINCGALMALRAQHEQGWRDTSDVVPSINDLILKATALTLKGHPRLNAALIDNAVHQYSSINLGVAIDIEAGLVVPVLRDAEKLSLTQIAAEVRRLADKARTGSLEPADFQNGTFTVSNLGGLGVDWFTPVLNPPQAAILGVGRIRFAPVVAGGEVEVGQIATLVVTFDHRVIDGAPCARFLTDLKALIESPEALTT
jgi:pyruvate dehydrogenase E2 component (dihydrolipoamide acetyltransferase)